MKQKLNCVLIIDDDEPTNFFNQIIVEESGCTDRIMVAQSGQQALDYLTKSVEQEDQEGSTPCPALIFLDINMPAMNGWEFMDKYKELDKKHHGKIIMVMLTTSLFPEDLVKAKEMPEISGYEHKPLTSEKLDRILKKHFDNGDAYAEAV